MEQQETDVCIIGAGPVGLFAVFQCGMLGIQTHIVDIMDSVGGQCTALYPEKPIYDIPAYPKISAENLIENLKIQISPFKPIFHLSQKVLSYKKRDNDTFEVLTNKNTSIICKAIFIAAGSGAFIPNKPPLKNIESFEDHSVFYFIKNKNIFSNKKIVIAGGGDSAVDWAVALSEIAEKVFVVHRRDNFRATDQMVQTMRLIANSGKIEIIVPYQLSDIEGENGILSNVIIEDMQSNKKSISADILLPFYGMVTKLGELENWGFNIHRGQIYVTQSSCETNIEGIYAIGDVAYYENKLKLILSGFSEAASAAHHIYNKIFPNKALHIEHSTSKFLHIAESNYKC